MKDLNNKQINKLTCPFCNGTAKVAQLPLIKKERWAIGCETDDCFANFCFNLLTFDSEEDAINAWNTRGKAYTKKSEEKAKPKKVTKDKDNNNMINIVVKEN